MLKKQTHLINELIATPSVASSSPCIGRLAGTNKQNDILVEYEGSGPKAAKLIATLSRSDLAREEQRGREVLIVFEKGDLQRPIIIGLMANPLEDLVSFQVHAEEAKEIKDVLIDGRRITIEAENEILLQCGKGSILIRKDGKIIIKGTDLLSRSSGRHRIRGASVGIN
jgi:hypothetical protein